MRRSATARRDHRSARKDDFDLGELAQPGINLDRTGVLLDDDVMADGEAKPGTFPGWFGCEEWIEHFFPYVGRNARAVVAYPDLHAVTEIPGGCGNDGFIGIVSDRCLTLRRCIEAIRDHIQQNSRNVLRKNI